jgi:hypothetical protein
MVGFADVLEVSQLYSLDTTYPRAVAFLVPLPRGILSQLADSQSNALQTNYDELSDVLNETAQAVSDYIEERGYAAYSRPVDEGSRRDCRFRPEPMQFLHHEPGGYVSHLEVAMHAGLGWLGKCGHIVTKPFGSAVVVDSVLTDMPLECCKDVFLSRCGRCQECLYACQEMSNRQAALASAVESAVAARSKKAKNAEDGEGVEGVEGESVAAAEAAMLNTAKHPGGQDADSASQADIAQSNLGCASPGFTGKVYFAFGQPKGAESMCGACIYSCPYTKSYMFRGAVSLN